MLTPIPLVELPLAELLPFPFSTLTDQEILLLNRPIIIPKPVKEKKEKVVKEKKPRAVKKKKAVEIDLTSLGF